MANDDQARDHESEHEDDDYDEEQDEQLVPPAAGPPAAQKSVVSGGGAQPGSGRTAGGPSAAPRSAGDLSGTAQRIQDEIDELTGLGNPSPEEKKLLRLLKKQLAQQLELEKLRDQAKSAREAVQAERDNRVQAQAFDLVQAKANEWGCTREEALQRLMKV
ncbi:MAG: hypothetical protein RLW87_20395 [Alphaproteobacteria bacterium]